MQRFKFILLLTLVCLVGCQTQSSSPASKTIKKSETKHLVHSYDQYDQKISESDRLTTIDFKANKADIKGNGAKQDGKVLTISEKGSYQLSGNYKGNLVIDVPSSDVVHLILDDFKLDSPQSGAIEVKQAKKLVITLADGTKNQISDQALKKADKDKAPKATIISKSSLTFNGKGALNITARHKNAVQTSEALVFMSGTYTVKAEDDGLKSTKAVVINQANIKLEAKGDGIVAKDDKDDKKGYILIENGHFDLSVGKDALQSGQLTELIGGDYQLKTAGSQNPDDSAKGIKSDGLIAITNGVYDIDSFDDSINATDIDISGGNLTLATRDDAVHADGNLAITAGMLKVTNSLEGIEGATISIKGGNLNVTATDDAINGSTGDAGTEAKLEINGGDILLTANGDGIDVNGDFTMTGGRVTVFASPTGENMVIDYDNLFKLEGGTLIGVGTFGMLGDTAYENMKSEYVQPTLTIPLLNQPAGTQLQVFDSTNKEVAKVVPSVNYSYAIVSSPEIRLGETYSIFVNGQSAGSLQAMRSQISQNP